MEMLVRTCKTSFIILRDSVNAELDFREFAWLLQMHAKLFQVISQNMSPLI